jgi:hypothetical protein
MRTHAEKAVAFRALHDEPGTFTIPNPWDAGTARLLAGLGFDRYLARWLSSCSTVPMARTNGETRFMGEASPLANESLVSPAIDDGGRPGAPL